MEAALGLSKWINKLEGKVPVRFLRPGLTNSVKWNSIDWASQSLYVRLLTLVDDFGRYDADSRLLKGHAFALREDISLLAIENMCSELSTQDLVEFYSKDGKPYLQLTNWKERARSESKFPDPKDPLCKHLRVIENNCLLPSPSPSPQPSPTPTPSPTASTRLATAERARVQKAVPKPTPSQDFTVAQRIEAFSKRLSAAYQRPNGKITDYAEQSILSAVCRRPDATKELDTILAYRSNMPPSDRRYFPQSVCRLLEKWEEVLDRARAAHTPASLNSKLMSELNREAARVAKEAGV